jgi:hypothetical protein
LGKRVVVEGLLRPKVIQRAILCDSGCCARAEGTLLLWQGSHHVSLWDERFPLAFRCSGDESLLCCGFATVPAGTRVRVVATVREGPGDVPASTVTLGQPAMCRVE